MGIHAFLVFEYLEQNAEVEHDTTTIQRKIQRLDFGPRGNIDRIIGKSLITKKEFTWSLEHKKLLKRIEVGPHWSLNTKDVLAVFEDILSKYESGDDVTSYSSFGGPWAFLRRKTGVSSFCIM